MTELAVDWLRMYAGSIILVCAFVLWWVFSGVEARTLTPAERQQLLDEHNERFIVVNEAESVLDDEELNRLKDLADEG